MRRSSRRNSGGWTGWCSGATYAARILRRRRSRGSFAILKLYGGAALDYTIRATDLGQAANPDPPDGFALSIDRFLEAGFRQDDVSRVARENPAELLG